MRLLRRRAPEVLVLGGGATGNRHARHLGAAGANVSMADPNAARARSSRSGATVPFDLAHLQGYDGIVVATPACARLDQAALALETGAKVLIEQPVGLDATDAERLAAAADQVMLGHHLRLHPPVVRIVSLANEGRCGRITAVRVWFGSYLPDWRPTVDYRESYSARAELGGGILLDAIHDLDLLLWVLGPRLEVVAAQMARLGDLDLDVEDTVRALLRGEDDVMAEVSFDYLSRRYRRGIEIIGTDATLRLDWAREVIEVEADGDAEVEPAIDALARSYERQAECFLAWIKGDALPPVDGRGAVAPLRLADQIRSAAVAPVRSG